MYCVSGTDRRAADSITAFDDDVDIKYPILKIVKTNQSLGKLL
jgi:hypothetical protein